MTNPTVGVGGSFAPTGVSVALPSAAITQAMQEAASRIDKELSRRTSAPMTMSIGGRDKLTIVQTELIADIGTDAIKIARRSGVSTVDERHVDEAAARLGASEKTNALTTIVNNVGGILVGRRTCRPPSNTIH